MKTKLLKISVITTTVIFLFAGASWAGGAKNRHHRQGRDNQIRTKHDRSHGYQEPSHFNYRRNGQHYKKHYNRHRAVHRAQRHAFKHHQKYHRAARHALKHRHKYHRPVHRHDHYRRQVIHKHYRKHKSSYNVFSYRASVFEPGWSITIKTKSRW